MSVLFNKIMIALPSDNQAAAKLAKLGLAIAETHQAQARLVSVLTSDIPPTPVGVGTAAFDAIAPNPPVISEAAKRKRKKMIGNLIDKHTSRDPTSHTIRFGNPTREIVDEAESWQADMIVMGSRERSWLERLIDPSVSQTVTRQADCAVLVLPNHMSDSGPT